jgi:hypothetical protein
MEETDQAKAKLNLIDAKVLPIGSEKVNVPALIQQLD